MARSEEYKRKNKIYRKLYEKTLQGYLMRTYRNMKSRVLGINKPHLYKGLGILSKEEFYAWSKRDTSFNELHLFWTKIGYDPESSPSIDRIDPTKGYILSNMRWITKYENSANGLKTRYAKKENL